MVHIQEPEDIQDLVRGDPIEAEIFLGGAFWGINRAEDRQHRHDDQKRNRQAQGRKGIPDSG